MKNIIMLIFIFLLLFSSGCDTTPDETGVDQQPPSEEEVAEGPLMGRVTEPVAIDGSSAGYPSAPIEAAGLTVYLAHDGETLFAYAEGESEGWLAIGFNSAGGGMNGANIIIGSVDGAEPIFRDDFGSGRSHSEAEVGAVEDFFFSYDSGRAIMEFSYPLAFPEGQGYNVESLVPGETYSLIVALHGSSDDFARQHSTRGSINFTVEQ